MQSLWLLRKTHETGCKPFLTKTPLSGDITCSGSALVIQSCQWGPKSLRSAPFPEAASHFQCYWICVRDHSCPFWEGGVHTSSGLPQWWITSPRKCSHECKELLLHPWWWVKPLLSVLPVGLSSMWTCRAHCSSVQGKKPQELPQ